MNTKNLEVAFQKHNVISIGSSTSVCISFLSPREQGDLSATLQACQNPVRTRAGGNTQHAPQCSPDSLRLQSKPAASVCQSCLLCSELDRSWWGSAPAPSHEAELGRGLSLCSCLARADVLHWELSGCSPRKLICSLQARNAAEDERISQWHRGTALPLGSCASCARRAMPPQTDPGPPTALPHLAGTVPKEHSKLTCQTPSIWDPRSAPTQAELRICSYQGPVSHVLLLLIPLPESAINC